MFVIVVVAISIPLLLTGLGRCRTQTSFRLRQHSTCNFYLCFVFALAERKNETQKKVEYRLLALAADAWVKEAVAQIHHHVREHDQRCIHERRAHDHRIIALEERADKEAADA